AAEWKANNLKPSERASDFEFIRRASLDIIGRIATPQEIVKFREDPERSRRALLIERLLDSDEYAKNWASIWTVWLMTRSSNRTYQEQMQLWLEEQFAKKDCKYDKIVYNLVTATGENNENAAVKLGLEDDASVNPKANAWYDPRNMAGRWQKAEFFEKDKKGNPQRLDPASKLTRRQQLAEYIVKSEYLPKAYVNRIWGHFF